MTDQNIPEEQTAQNTKPFLMLTQDNCPNCEHLKLMLAKPLRGKFDNDIEIVHRESDPKLYKSITEQLGIQSAPSLIRKRDNAMCTRITGLGEVRNFLQNR